MQNIVEFIKEQMSNRGMTYDLLAERGGDNPAEPLDEAG